MLDQRTSKQILRSQGNDLHLLLHLLRDWNLDGGSRYLVEPTNSTIRPWICGWRQVKHNTRLRCRVRTKNHSGCPNYDVANVDSVRNHAGFHRLCGVPRYRLSWSQQSMAMDVGLNFHPTSYRHVPSLPLP